MTYFCTPIMTKPVTPVVSFLVGSRSGPQPFSRNLKLLFILFHVVFALDFGFIKIKRMSRKVLLKLFTFSQMSILFAFITYSVFAKYFSAFSSWYFFDVNVFYSYAFFMLISKHTFYDFLTDLYMFDKEIELDSDSNKLELKISITLLVDFAVKLSVTLWYCTFSPTFCAFPAHIQGVYYISLLGENIVLIVYSYLFQSVNYRMKKFCSFVRNDRVDVVTCQYLYKRIVEITEKTKRSFDLVMVVSLVSNTFELILSMYAPLAEGSVKSELPLDAPLSCILVIQQLLVLFGPPVTAGLLSSQVEALRLVLYEKLVKDHILAKDIKRFINYIDVRPMRFKVYSVIPLDWRLPVIVINISVTYLIVMIQFTAKK